MTDTDISYESFLKYQSEGLKTSNVPKRYWRKLYDKIVGQVFDAGNDFSLVEIDETHRGIPRESKYRVVVTNPDGIQGTSFSTSIFVLLYII